MATKTLNVKVPVEQYEEIEEIVKTQHYTSKSEFIRDLVRQSVHDYVAHLHRKASDDEEFTRLEDFGADEGLE